MKKALEIKLKFKKKLSPWIFRKSELLFTSSELFVQPKAQLRI